MTLSMTRSQLLGCLLLAAGCGKHLEPYQDPPGRVRNAPVSTGQHALRAMDSCDDLLVTLREREASIMRASIEANRRYAIAVVTDRDQNCYDPEDDGCGLFGLGCWMPGAAMDDRLATMPPSQNGASDFSTTNNQVAGVDEPDFVKNDGQRILVTADDTLYIFAAWPPTETQALAAIELEGEPERIFLAGDRVIVLADTGDPYACSYDPYYGSQPSAQTLQVTVWDISTPTAPVLERRAQLSGAFVAARLVDGVVHLVVDFPDLAAAPFEVWPEGLRRNLCNEDVSVEQLERKFDRLLEANLAAIAVAPLAYFLPGVVDQDFVAGALASTREQLFTDCADFYAADRPETGYLGVLSFPTHDDAILGATHIIGRVGEVYASAESVYVAVKEFVDQPGEGWESGWWGAREQTAVHKFSLAAGGAPAVYRGSGAVAGTVLNQFAMDEHEGALRIATTEWAERTNNLFVLAEAAGGAGLLTIGAVRDIAPGEDIRAVRFAGARGFVVTFRQTDPLFTFELSDPTEPRLVGELHVPGFSTYIHLMDPDHLLSIGFDADDSGMFRGVMLQIFAVGDLAAPELVHREIIGTRGTMSDATANHLAFNYFPSRNLLAIPIGICESDGFWNEELTFNGLYVYNVTAASGFELIGGVDHRDGDNVEQGCGSWWTDPDSQVKRSVFLEDYVFSFSSTRMKVNHVADLGQTLVSVGLPASEWQDAPECRPEREWLPD